MTKNDSNQTRFVTEYVNRYTGKLMRARDYGYVAWPFGRRRS